MADKRIDIEVVDKGSDKAAKGLRAIAVEADKASKSLSDMSKHLAAMPSAKLAALGASARSAEVGTAGLQRGIAVLQAQLTTLNASLIANTAAQSGNTAATQASVAAKSANTAALSTNTGALMLNHEAMESNASSATKLDNEVKKVDASSSSLSSTLTKMPPQGIAAVTVAVVALAAAAASAVGFVAGIARELNNDSGVKNYAASLGLTAKEIKRLEDNHITLGDTAKGVFETILQANGTSTEKMKEWWESALDSIVAANKRFVVFVIAGLRTLDKTAWAITDNIANAFKNLGTVIYNFMALALERVANKFIDTFNTIASGINAISNAAGWDKTIDNMDRVSLGVSGMSDGLREMVTVSPSKWMEEESAAVSKQVDKIADNIKTNIRKAFQERIGEQAADIISNRGAGRTSKPKVDRTEENRAHALKMVNEQLDNELSRMRMLKPEREIQQKMDQIEEQLLRKKITLNDQERASILAKVTAIRSENEIMAESDRIMEDLTKAQRVFDAGVEALNRRYDDGSISAENYQLELKRISDTYEEANDPLFKYQKTLDENNRTMGLYGDALEQANFQEQMRLALLAHSGPLDEAGLARLRERVRLMGQEFAMSQQQKMAADMVQQVAGPALEDQNMLANKDLVYEALEARRQVDLQNETAYLQAKLALNRKFSDLENKNTLDTFDELAKLSSSGYAELAAIGKAAAIARATYNMYLAASEALTLPFPANIPAIAKTLVMGTQIISQLKSGGGSTHAGGFYTGGQIMVGGRSGRDANNINMDVTRGERITIETPAQQRATDNAIAAGQASQGGQAAAPVIQNVVVIDPQQMVSAINTDAGATQILNVIQARPQEFNAVLGRT